MVELPSPWQKKKLSPQTTVIIIMISMTPTAYLEHLCPEGCGAFGPKVKGLGHIDR